MENTAVERSIGSSAASFCVCWLSWCISDEVNNKQISGKLLHCLIWMIKYVMKSRRAGLKVYVVKFCSAIDVSWCQSVEVAVTPRLHRTLSVSNCDAEIFDFGSSYQVRMNLQLWFRWFAACLVQTHGTLELRNDSRYSLRKQHSNIYSQLHNSIAADISTLLRQIQHGICRIIKGWNDYLSDIELMCRILTHHTRIPGLSEEYSWVFARSGMTFMPTSNPLSCQVWWSQIWQRMHILFNG
jgi:hypothetical protein